MAAFDRMKGEQEHGGRPINGPRFCQCKTRRKKKVSAKSQWYKTDAYSNFMFVLATPNGKLAEMLRESESKMGTKRAWRVKIKKREDRRSTLDLPKIPRQGRATEKTVWSVDTRPKRKKSAPCSKNTCCYLIECRYCRTKGADTVPRRAADTDSAVGEPGKTKVEKRIHKIDRPPGSRPEVPGQQRPG